MKEVWMKSILQTMSESVVLIDNDGKITYMNRAAETLTGWTLKQVEAQDFYDYIELFDEKTGNLINNPLESVLLYGEEAYSDDETLLQGKIIIKQPVDFTAVPIRNDNGEIIGAAFICKDASERKRGDEIFDKSYKIIGKAKREWETAVDSLSFLVCLLDENAEIIRSNMTVDSWGLARIFEVKGKPAKEIFHPESDEHEFATEFAEIFKSAMNGKAAEMNVKDAQIKAELKIEIVPVLEKEYREGEEIDSAVVMVVRKV